MKKEIIICAANWYDNGEPNHAHSVINRKTGFVLAGWRHCAINQLLFHLGMNRLTFKEVQQGFITNTNKFANRKQAAYIAYKAGQITEEKWKSLPCGQLTSEDIY
jgi:hypothetical protein